MDSVRSRRWPYVALILWRGFWIFVWFNLAAGGASWLMRDVLNVPLVVAFPLSMLVGLGGAWAAWDETKDDPLSARLRARRT